MPCQFSRTDSSLAPVAICAALLLSICVPDRAFAQQESLGLDETRPGNIAVGISAGPRLSAFWGPDAAGSEVFQATESRQTYSLGARAQYRLSRSWSVQTSLHYVRAGQKYKGIDAGQRYSSQVRLAYLQVPVLARVRLFMTRIMDRRMSVDFSAGPYFSALLNAEEEINLPGNEQTDDISPVTRPVSWGGQAGVSVSIPLSVGQVGIETRYNFGLRDVNTSSVNVKNQGLTVALTFDVSI